MEKKVFLLFVFLLILMNFAYAQVPDADKDGVPDEKDKCPNTETIIVDDDGCSCSQKTSADCNGTWCCSRSKDNCFSYCAEEGSKANCIKKSIDVCGTVCDKYRSEASCLIQQNCKWVKDKCLPSCTVWLAAHKYNDAGLGCCNIGCLDRGSIFGATFDCDYCCESFEKRGCEELPPPPLPPERWISLDNDTSGDATDCNVYVPYEGNADRYNSWNNECEDNLQAPNSGGIGQGCCELACGADAKCDELLPSGDCEECIYSPLPTDTSGAATDCNVNVPYKENEDKYALWNGQCNDYLQAPNSGGIGQGCCELACNSSEECDEQFPDGKCADCSGKEKLFITNGLKAYYYDTDFLKGGFVEKVDNTIDFDWKEGSPDPLIGKDKFGATWAGQVKIDKAGKYTFYTETDDGVKLYIDKNDLGDVPKIDDPRVHGVTENKVELYLTEGWHEIRMDYFEDVGTASAKLYYSSESMPKQIIPSDHLITLYVILRIRAEKNKYAVGDEIKLTGYEKPPIVDINKSEAKGLIVQLRGEPAAEKLNKLSLEIKNDELKLESSSLAYKYTLGWFDRVGILYKKLRLNGRVNEHIKTLDDQQIAALANIENTLSPLGTDVRVLSRHKLLFNGMALDVPLSEANNLKKLKSVMAVYPNYKVYATLDDSVPIVKADSVWNLKDSNDLNIKGKGKTIAIIDTGIDYKHSDLGGCFGKNCKVVDGYDFVNKDNDPIDDRGHGTHVAGIAAANGVIKGVAPEAKLYAYKVLNSFGSGLGNDIISAIERAIDPNQDGKFDDHVDIVSMSLGGFGIPNDPRAIAVNNAVKNGVVVVVAAGNSGPRPYSINCPGCARDAITVGASCKHGQSFAGCGQGDTPQIAAFSSRGSFTFLSKPDIVAPGVMICSSRWDDSFSRGGECKDKEHIAISGTSMATPHVAGIAALILQKHPDWSPLQVKAALKSTAENFGYYTNVQGAGLVNALKAVELQNPPPVSVITNVNPSGAIFDFVDEPTVQEKIEIYGVSSSSYKLEYSPIDKEEWSSKGIEILNEQRVNDKLLAKFDTTQIDDGKYKIKLQVESSDGIKSQDIAMVDVRNKFISGIINYEYVVMDGLLTMKVQKLEDSGWVDQKIIVNNEKVTIEDFLLLADLWGKNEGFIAKAAGIYRIYVELKIGDVVLNDSFEFEVN